MRSEGISCGRPSHYGVLIHGVLRARRLLADGGWLVSNGGATQPNVDPTSSGLNAWALLGKRGGITTIQPTGTAVQISRWPLALNRPLAVSRRLIRNVAGWAGIKRPPGRPFNNELQCLGNGGRE